jgi:hypothetical protein
LAKIVEEVDGTKCGELCCYKHWALGTPLQICCQPLVCNITIKSSCFVEEKWVMSLSYANSRGW